MPTPEARLAALSPRLRIDFGAGVRFGHGKADLLDAIVETGSISAAGRKLGMSYRRAWLLVEELNTLFDTPVVMTSAGGAHGGGTQLTPFGHQVLGAFRQVEARTRAAIGEEFAPLAAHLLAPVTP